MHIGYFSPAWPANEYPNGIVTYVEQLRAELRRQGHRVSVFCNAIGSSKDTQIYLVRPPLIYRIHQKLEQFRGASFPQVLNWGQVIAATIRQVTRRDRIDVLEMEESFGWCADVQNLASVATVTKLHGPAFLTLAEEKSEFVSKRIQSEGAALRLVSAIVSPSQYTLTRTIEHYSLSPRIHRVIPNPVTVEPNEKWEWNRCDKRTLLFIGRFDALKGGDIALQIFRKLLNIDDRLRLIFAGPDVGIMSESGRFIKFQEFVDGLFTDQQKSNITYLGKLPRNELPELRQRCLLNLLVSRWENQPNTALEAMAQGCPVVGFDVGGMSQIIINEVTGLLARPNDLDDFCQKVISLLDDPKKAIQIGHEALRFVNRHHSVENVARAAIALYRDAIAAA